VRSGWPGGAAIVALLVVPPTAAPLHQAPDVSTRAVVAAARAYVAAYQDAFRFLVADETYRQSRFTGDGPPVETRTMHGELFLTYLAGDDAWMAVHDVADVDGTAVEDREDLRALLQKGESFTGIAKRLAERNARFNIGGIERNFNEPTLALTVLGARRTSNFAFDRAAVERTGDATLVRLTFREKDRPTIVHSTTGKAAPSHGELIVEAGTGRIRQTTFEVTDGTVAARLETIYGWDEHLQMWLPATFNERYGATRKGAEEFVACQATYDNYRRFEVTGRIIKR
jgi:hypothetical protein